MGGGKKSIGYWEVVAIGIGGMVGGGIFAVLGLAVKLAHGGTPIAFAISGLVALLTTYSYVKLSLRYPSQGGTVTFLNRGFGRGIVTGSLNMLLWLSYIVMLSLYAYAFGYYGATFFHNPEVWAHILISGIIISIAVLNTFSANVVGKVESGIVATKIAILLIFVILGIPSISIHRMAPSTWSPPLSLVAGGMIIFLAYEGFELIANTAQDVRDPHKTLPRAYYSAVVFVILLYISVAIVTVGNLSIHKIVAAQDYALAEAAKPFMGHFGFTLIAVAAMLSTASAINATLYGSTRFSYIIAQEGELPTVLTKPVEGKPLLGLMITMVVNLFIANFFNLSSISIMGSAGFLLIFAAVNAANIRLAKETESHKWLSALGLLACLSALGALIWQTLLNWPQHIWVLVIMIVLAVVIEVAYQQSKGQDSYMLPIGLYGHAVWQHVKEGTLQQRKEQELPTDGGGESAAAKDVSDC